MAASWIFIAILIEFVGGLIITGHVIGAIYSLYKFRSIEKARLIVASGAIAGLDFKTAATLLKTLQLSSWDQIGMFVAILSLRILLKRMFSMERKRHSAPVNSAAD